MLGAFLALLAAITFATNNAAFRRGALGGSVLQAMSISLLIGVAIMLVVVLLFGQMERLGDFPGRSVLLLSLAGVLHFAWGRYCNFRATKAIGANLVAPVQQLSLLVTLALAVLVLGEALTPIRVIGILLLLIGPAFTLGSGPAPVAPERKDLIAFTPNYAEGYLFALLSATGYGVSPILVRTSLADGGLGASLAGAFIAHLAAGAVIVLVLLVPRNFRNLMEIRPAAAKWYTASGVLVCLSQIFGYMALAVAPVSVVIPIQRLSLIFRVYVNTLLNRDYEAVGGRIWAGTIVAFLGAAALSVSTDFVLGFMEFPPWAHAVLEWHWP